MVAFCTLFVCAGIGFFSWPVFLKFIEADTGWGRDSLSYAAALSALAAGFISPLIGYFIDRYGTRAVMIPGAIVLSVAFVLLSRASAVYQLYLLFLATGVGMAATTMLPCQTLVSRWFKQKRGRAMGVVVIGNALGGVAWMNVSNRLIETAGWRNAYWILGIIIAAVSLPLIWLIVRDSPKSMGLMMDGRADPLTDAGESGDEAQSDAGEDDYTMREALGTGSFWLIFCATFFVMFASSGFGLHIIAFLSDSGLSSEKATAIWSTSLAIGIGGRFLFGFVAEKLQKRYMAAAANVFRAMSLLLLLLYVLKIVPQSAATAQLVILYGLGQGCNAVINPLVVSETFGVKAFGKLMGLLGIPFTIGMALGLAAGGRLYVLRDNYNLAFSVFALAFLLAGTAISFARPHFLFDTLSAGRERGVEQEKK